MSSSNKKQTLSFVVAGSILAIGVTVVTLVAAKKWFRRRDTKKGRRDDDKEQTQQQQQQNDADDDDILEQLFQKAAASLKDIPDDSSSSRNMTQGDKLMLYGLYKQATVGNRDNFGERVVVRQPPPSRINVVAHAKYTAWGQFHGMSKQAAMIHYMEAVQHFAKESSSNTTTTNVTTTAGGSSPMAHTILPDDDNADIVYNEEEEDEEEEYYVPTSSMGLRPSTLILNNENNNNDDAQSTRSDSSSPMATNTPHDLLRTGASTNNVEMIQLALEQGASLEETDELGQTALHFAADRGALDALTFLLSSSQKNKNNDDAMKKVNPNATDCEGISVLQAAVIAGNTQAVKLLLEAGANPDLPDMDGDTPRTCAHDADSDCEMKLLFEDV